MTRALPQPFPVDLEQIHSGDTLLTAVLGDGVSLPNQPIEVEPAGESTAKAAIVVPL